MSELKNIRFSFLAIAFLICNLVVLPFDFFVQIKFSIPFWSFYLLEICFAFLVLFAAFPKNGLSVISKISTSFLVFLSICFLFQGFLPFAAEHKLFAFEFQDNLANTKIVINLVGLVVMHILACFLFASELLRKEDSEELHADFDQGSTLQYQREENEAMMMREEFLDEEVSQEEYYQEDYQEEVDYKEEVNSLFDIYLDDYENNQFANNEVEEAQKLHNMEELLINNLKEGVTGAMCINPKGEELHDQVFHWQGFNKFDLLELFKANDNLCKSLEEGSLCQVLFSDSQHWYLIIKYRGNYLLLQTNEKQPDELIENGFYLVQAIREQA
jgi:hypothetical protein